MADLSAERTLKRDPFSKTLFDFSPLYFLSDQEPFASTDLPETDLHESFNALMVFSKKKKQAELLSQKFLNAGSSISKFRVLESIEV
jgi:hypothetical protein